MSKFRTVTITAVVALCLAPIMAFLFVMFLMMFGPVEWTCHEAGSNWTCTGPHCDKDADTRFNIYKKTMSCDRTDWTAVTLKKVFLFLIPEAREQAGHSLDER